ncbi:RNA recognition motif domain-containing protein [Candidatus Binatus sp.]|uniref:RNA recognition motif domain-containing protein n=1 Tax=Candidatus Binatus sp. TaxID=2811406 RepID=UPI003C3D210B
MGSRHLVDEGRSGTRVFVGNLGAMSERELSDLFQPYSCTAAAIVVDPTGRSRGFGFVEVDDSTRAILDLDGQTINGRRLHVAVAKPRR